MLTPMSRLRARPNVHKPENYGGSGVRAATGPGIALSRPVWVRRWLVPLLWLALVPLSGCLVTEQITFDEEADLPTVIVDAPGSKTPIGSIVWLDKSAAPSWDFKVKARDENLTQELTAHYRVVTQEDDTPEFESIPLKPVESELRDLTLTVKSETLRVGECHHLQLAVSAAFLESTRPVFDAVPPGRENDVAYATWWLWEGPGSMQATDLPRLAQSCGAIEDLLVPTVVEEAP